jgi:2-methylisocitrate lyase-like PEP mutase family enzyme
MRQKAWRKRSGLQPRWDSLDARIEDATGNQGSPLYDVRLAVERIAAISQVARALQFPFILTARAHSFPYAAPSLDETISRLHAFEEAGADVLFAPRPA